jgi:hypothetical protein
MTQRPSPNEQKLPQPGDFAGHWRVVAGDIGHTDPGQEPDKKYFAVLVFEPGEEIHRLFSQKEENGIVGEMVWRQDLSYDSGTGTLVSAPEELWLERSISFWRGNEATGRPDCIYAMRTTDLEGVDPQEAEARLLPWEYRKEPGDDGAIIVSSPYGAWGADGG